MKDFKGKKKDLFVLAALATLSLYSIKNLGVTCVPAAAYESFCVELEYFGMDAEKIERTIALPLEEKISSLENLASVWTCCEYSKCAANLIFEKTRQGAYFSLSSALEELRKSLPADAQRPKIYANSSEAKWIFTAAFDAKKFSREDLEKRLKAPLQKIPGVSQAAFLGGDAEELQIAFDEKRLSQKDAEPWFLAELLQGQRAAAIFGDGRAYFERLQSVHDLNQNSAIRGFAAAKEAFKPRDSMTRINGAECVLVSLKSSEESKNIKIAAQARKILKKEFGQKGGFQIVFDNGKEQERLLLKLFAAFAQSLFALGAVCAIFYRSAKKAAAILSWTALDLLFSLGLMAALKIPLDSSAISGITISLGLICDAALYLADDAEPSLSALAAATLTTICASLALASLEPIAPGIKNLSLASAITIGASYLLALRFLPVFFSRENADGKAGNFLNLSIFSYRPPRKVLKLSYFLYILTPLIFVFSAKNLSAPDESRTIRAQVEYPSSRRFDLIDEELLPFIESVKKIKGVAFVQSEARRGSAEVNVALEPGAKKAKICKELLTAGKNLSGSLYIPLSPPKNKIVQKIQVSVLGGQSGLCQALCKEAARAALKNDFFAKTGAQAVFHFKEPERIYLAKPKKHFLAQNGLNARSLAHFLRWNLFGAVAAKREIDGRIQDARAGQKDFAFGQEKALWDLERLHIRGIPVAALCSVQEAQKPDKIYRKDGKRAAHWTLEVETKKSDKAFRELKAALKDVNLPDGYFFSFPREYENMGKNYALAFAAFALALAGIFFLTAAQCERPLDALKSLATIPQSLFLPLLLRAIAFSPLKLGDAAAMVFVSGICVNNALYIMSEWNLRGRKDAFLAAKTVLRSVLSSSATTLCGSLPLIFLGAGSFSGDLAFFTFFGTLGSLAAGLFVFPATLEGKRRNNKKRRPSPPREGRPLLSFTLFRFRRICSWELSSLARFRRRWPKRLRQGRS